MLKEVIPRAEIAKLDTAIKKSMKSLSLGLEGDAKANSDALRNVELTTISQIHYKCSRYDCGEYGEPTVGKKRGEIRIRVLSNYDVGRDVAVAHAAADAVRGYGALKSPQKKTSKPAAFRIQREALYVLRRSDLTMMVFGLQSKSGQLPDTRPR